MLVLTRSRGRPSKRRPMSSRVEIATPTRPTSPRASGASLSYPICVGRSNATLSPSLPCARRYWNRRFVSFAVPKPAYCRIVQRRPRYIVARMPLVNGGSPGNPILEAKSRANSFAGVRATSRGRPLPVCRVALVGGEFSFVGLKGSSSACVESPWRSNVAPTGGREIRISSVRRPGESEGGHGDAFAANDASDDPSLNVGTQGADHVLRILLRRDEGEAHSHVEGLIHLAALDPAELGEGAEDRGRLERIGDPELHVGLEPDQIPHTPSRDVRHPVDGRAAQGAEDRADVDRGRLQQLLAPRSAASADRIKNGQGGFREDPSSQCQAVRMDPGARHPDNHIPRSNRTTVNDLRLSDGAETGPRQVESAD